MLSMPLWSAFDVISMGVMGVSTQLFIRDQQSPDYLFSIFFTKSDHVVVFEKVVGVDFFEARRFDFGREDFFACTDMVHDPVGAFAFHAFEIDQDDLAALA